MDAHERRVKTDLTDADVHALFMRVPRSVQAGRPAWPTWHLPSV
jgi:hypothetical protein